MKWMLFLPLFELASDVLFCFGRSLLPNLRRNGYRPVANAALALVSDWVGLAVNLVTRREQQGYRGMALLMRRIIERVPDSAVGHRLLGLACYHIQRNEEALAFFQAALRLGDRARFTRQGLRLALLAMNPRARPIIELAAAHRENEHCRSTTYAYGWSLLSLQRFDDVLALADRLLARRPRRPECHALRAFAFLQFGRYRDALAEFDRAAQVDPVFVREKQLNLQRAYLRGRMGDMEDARAAFRQQYLPRGTRRDADLGPYLLALLQRDVQRLGLEGTIGFFFVNSPTALGHTILDPFHAYNLFRMRFDHLVMVTPPTNKFDRSTRVALQVTEQAVPRIETTERVLCNLSWQELGEIAAGKHHFLLHNYWGLNRLVYKAREDPSNALSRQRAHYRLPPRIRDMSEAICRKHHIDLTCRIVVLHVREHNYHSLHSQRFRNTDIGNYLPAIRRLTASGYLVVRIGDRTMTPIADRVPGLLELPLARYYLPFLDPFFIARCDFMIGCQSGPCSYARAFGKPSLIVNGVYHYTLIPERQELVSFKRYYRWEGHHRTPLSCQEIADAGLHLLDNTKQFSDHGIDLEDMSPDEILAAVEEMLEWMKEPDRPETALQQQFRTLMRQAAQQRYPLPQWSPLTDYIGYALPECRLAHSVASMRAGFLTQAA